MGYNKNNRVDEKYKRIRSILYKMHDRCENPKNQSYKRYGGRGIVVCDDWSYDANGISNFIKWSIENGYDVNLEIDRINNDDSYSPQNCRWTSHKINCNNKSDNRIVEHNNDKYTVSELSEKFGINKNTIIERLNNNFDNPIEYQRDFQHLKRKVYQYTKEKQFVKEYESIIECARQLNTLDVCISRVCNGHRKTHKGFIFTFNKGEFEND